MIQLSFDHAISFLLHSQNATNVVNLTTLDDFYYEILLMSKNLDCYN